MPSKNIAIITGGPGEEREISLLSAANVVKALSQDGYDLKIYDLPRDLEPLFQAAQRQEIDLAIPVIHGRWGEDGLMPALLELLNIPYLFSDHLVSALAMDKAKTKKVLATEGITMAPGVLLGKTGKPDLEMISSWGWPLVVKPNDSGSSFGVSLAGNEKELKEALVKAFASSQQVLIEKFIKGRELTVAVSDYQGEAFALPVIEIIPKISSWFDYEAKYSAGGSDEICPARIPDAIAAKVQALAVKIFKALGCRDLARADFIWDEANGELVFLEINTVPGLTDASLTPKALRAAGLDLPDFFRNLVDRRLPKYKAINV